MNDNYNSSNYGDSKTSIVAPSWFSTENNAKTKRSLFKHFLGMKTAFFLLLFLGNLSYLSAQQVDATPDGTYGPACSNGAPIVLSAEPSLSGVQRGRWTIENQDGTAVTAPNHSDDILDENLTNQDVNATFYPSEVTISTGTSITFRLIYTFDEDGDFNTTRDQISDNTLITVNKAPEPTGTAASNDICENGGMIFLTGNPGVNSGTGEWSGASGITNIANSNNAQFDPRNHDGVVSLTYTYTDGNNCAASNVVKVVVHSADVTTPASNASVCANEDAIPLKGIPNENSVLAILTADNTITGVTAGTGQWSDPNGDLTKDADGEAVFDPAGFSGPVMLTYTYTSGESNCEESITTTVNVFAAPTVDAGEYGPLCEDDDALLLNQGTPVQGGTSTGTWSVMSVTNNDGGIDDADILTESNPSAGTAKFNPEVEGEGVYVLEYEFLDLNGCMVTDMTTITVNPKPTVDFETATATALGMEYCVNSSSFVIEGTPNPADIVGSKGEWSGPGVNDDPNIEDNNATFDPALAGSGTHTIKYSYEDEKGCSGEKTIDVVVNGLTTLSTGGPYETCRDGDGATDLTIMGFPNDAQGVWSGPAITENAADGTATFDPDDAAVANQNSVVVTYTYTDANSCINTINTTININEPEIDPITNLNICGRDNFYVPFSGNATSYNWEITGANIGLTTTSAEGVYAIEGTAINNGAATLTATVEVTPLINGCEGPSKTFDIDVKPLPSVTSITDPQTLCEGGNSTLIDIQVSTGAAFTWENDNTAIGLAGSGSADIPAFPVENDEDYPITGFITVTPTLAGCMGDVETTSITVKPLPTITVPDDQELCEGEFTTEVILGGSPVGGTNYSWTVTDDANGSIGLVANNTPIIPSIQAENEVFVTLTATINIMAEADGCELAAPESFDIAVNPITHLDELELAYPSLDPFCSTGLDTLDLNEANIPNAREPTTSLQLGLWSQTSGVSDRNPEAGTAIFDPNGLSGDIELTYTFSNAFGCIDEKSLTVTVENAHPDPGTYSDVCSEDADVPLAGLNTLTINQSGTWSVKDDQGNPVTAPNPIKNADPINGTADFDPSGLRGIYTLVYTITNLGNGCESVGETTINVGSADVDLGNYDPVCENESAVRLTATPMSGSTVSGTWSVLDDQGDPLTLNPITTISGLEADFNPAGLDDGTYTLIFNYTNEANCTDEETTEIIVNGVTLVDAGLDQQFCQDDGLITLSGSVEPDVTNGEYAYWGPASIIADNVVEDADVSFNTALYENDVDLVYTYVDDKGCMTTDEVKITVNALPEVEAGTNLVLDDGVLKVCEDNPVIDIEATPAPGVNDGSFGSWTPAPSIIDVDNMDEKASFDSDGKSGAYNLIYTFTDANTCANSSTVTIDVIPPRTAYAGIDQSICENGGPITLTGATPNPINSGGTGVWSSSNNDIGLDVNDNTGDNMVTFNPLGLADDSPITITYTYTDETGCVAFDELLLTIHPIPVVDAGTYPDPICQNGSIELTGSPIGGTWSAPVGVGTMGGTTDGVATYMPNGETEPITLTYTYEENGCTYTDEAIITIREVIAGDYPAVCEGSALVELEGTPEPKAGEFGRWSWNGSTAVIDSDFGDNEAKFDPSHPDVLADIDGIIELTYEFEDSDNCIVISMTTIQVNSPVPASITATAEIPSPSPTTATEFCISTPAFRLEGGPVPDENDGDVGTWSSSSNGVTDDDTVIDQYGMFDPATAGVGEHVLTYTFTDNNTCMDEATVLVEVLPLPVVDDLSNFNAAEICNTNTTWTLNGSPVPAANETGVWSANDVADNISSAGVINPSALSLGDHTFTYTFTNDPDGCANTGDLMITVTGPDVDAGEDETYCQNIDEINLVGEPIPMGNATGEWEIKSGDGTIDNGSGANMTNGEAIYTPNMSNTTFPKEVVLTYIYTDISGCEARDDKVITILKPDEVEISLPDDEDEICENGVEIEITATPKPITLEESAVWRIDGDIVSSIDGSPDKLLFNSEGFSGEVIVSYTYTNDNNCETTAEQTITIKEVVGNAGGPYGPICHTDGDMDGLVMDLIEGSVDTEGKWTGTGIVDNVFTNSKANYKPEGLRGTYDLTFTFTTDANGCAGEDMTTVEVLNPDVDAGDDQVLCEDADPVTFIPNLLPVNGATGTWNSVVGLTDHLDGSATFDPDQVTGVLPQDITLTYTYMDASGCGNSDDVVITVEGKPGTPTITNSAGNNTICKEGGSITLTGSVAPLASNEMGIWTVDGDEVANLNSNIFEFDPINYSGSVLITYTFVDDNTCSATSNILTLSVTDLMPDAGEDKVVCESDNPIDLLGNLSTGSWSGPSNSIIDGTANDGKAKFDPNGLSGTVTLTYTVMGTGNGACTATSTMDVEVISTPVVLDSYDPVCRQSGAFQIIGNPIPSFDQTGFWRRKNSIYQASIIDNSPGDGVAMFDPSKVGDLNVPLGQPLDIILEYVFEDEDGCISIGETSIEVYDLPEVTINTTIPDVCAEGGTVTLSNATPVPQSPNSTGNWSAIDENGNDITSSTIVNTTDVSGTATFNPTGLAANTQITLIYTYTDSRGCSESAMQDITIIDTEVIIDPHPADVCINAPIVNLQGTDPVSALSNGVQDQTGLWSGDGITNSSIEDGKATFDPVAAGYGDHILTYTFYNGNQGGCTTTATTTITVTQPTTGSYGPVCIDDTDVTLQGFFATGGTGLWTGAGINSSITQSNGQATFDISAAGAGTHTLTYKFTDASGCMDQATTNIVVNDMPTVSAGADQVGCASGSGGIISLIGTPTDANGTWTATTGTVFTDNGNGTASFDPTGLTGSRTFTYIYTNANGCTDSDNVTVSIENMGANAGADQNFCFGDLPITLTGNVFEGNNRVGTWSGPGVNDGANINDGVATFNPSSNIDGPVTVTYTVTTSSGCTEASSATINVASPNVATGTYLDLCDDDGTITLTGSPIPNSSQTGIWIATQGITNSNKNDGVAIFDPSGLSGNITLTYRIISDNGCEHDASTQINVSPAAVIGTTHTTETVCEGESINLTGFFSGGATGIIWTAPNGNIVVTNPNTTGVEYTPTGIILDGGRTDYINLKAEVPSDYDCDPPEATITVIVTKGASLVLSGDKSICGNPDVALSAVTVGTGNTLTWTGPNGFSSTSTNPTYSPAALNGAASRNDVITVTASNSTSGCPTVSKTINISLNSAPAVTAAKDTIMTCEESVALLEGTPSGSATSFSWSLKSANSGVITVENSTSAYYAHDGNIGGLLREDVIYLTANSPNGACPAAKDSVLVQLVNKPAINLVADIAVCGTDAMQILPSGTGIGNKFVWSADNGSFDDVASKSPTYDPNDLSGAMTRDDEIEVMVTDSFDICPVLTETLTLRVLEAVKITEGTTGSVCNGDTMVLNADFPGNNSLFESTVLNNKGNVVVHESKIQYVPNSITAGPNRLDTVIITNPTISGNSACNGTSDTMIVTVMASPLARLISDTTICEGDNISLVLETFGTIDSFSSKYSSSLAAYPNFSIDFSNGSVKDTILYGTAALSGNCPAALDSVVVTIVPVTTIALNLADTTICEVNPITINSGLTDNTISHTWSVLGDMGTFNDSSLVTPIYTPNTGLTTTSRVDTIILEVVSADGCGTGTDTIFATILQTGSFTAVPDALICANNALGLNVSITGSIADFTWSGNNGTFADDDNPVTQYTPSALTGASRKDTIIASLTFSGNACPTVTDMAIIEVISGVVVDAGTDVEICHGSNTTLAGALGMGASSAIWSVLNTANGTFDDTTRLDATYTPAANTSTDARIDKLILTSNDPDGTGGCEVGTDTVEVRVLPTPTANLGTDITILDVETPTLTVVLSGAVKSSTWSSTNGTFTNSRLDEAVYVPAPLNGAASRVDQISYVATMENESCPNVSDVMLITVESPMAISKGVNAELCDALCLDNAMVTLGQGTGTVVVLANDIDPFDLCGVNSDYSFKIWNSSMSMGEPNTILDLPSLPSSLTLDCTDRGTNEVNVYVTDAEENTQLCPVTIEVMDAFASCGERTVSGRIVTPKGFPVEGFEVFVEDMGAVGGVVPDPTMTDADGRYEFVVKTEKKYRIVPYRNKDFTNGVTAFDNVVISRHILGFEKFTSPYQTIAADVNKSGAVTAFDIVLIRKVVLARQEAFDNNTSWRFIYADYEFPDVENAASAPFNESFVITETMGNLTNMDFIAVKVGDPNATAKVDGLLSDEATSRNGLDNAVFQTDDLPVEKGNTYKVPFQLIGGDKVKSYQFTMDFDGLELLKVLPGVASPEHFGLTHTAKGLLTACWSTATPKETDGTWFTLEFKATENGHLSELLTLTSQLTPIEAYTMDYENVGISLDFVQPIATTFDLFQNKPNPFKNGTTIGFALPEAAEAQITILDMQGKVMRTITDNYAAGFNEVNLDFSDFPRGVFYYRLETVYGTKVQKMMHIE